MSSIERMKEEGRKKEKKRERKKREGKGKGEGKEEKTDKILRNLVWGVA